jgi:hypothetical protein
MPKAVGRVLQKPIERHDALNRMSQKREIARVFNAWHKRVDPRIHKVPHQQTCAATAVAHDVVVNPISDESWHGGMSVTLADVEADALAGEKQLRPARKVGR